MGIGNDEDLFVISGNILSFNTAPDFETPVCGDNICTISITASDSVDNAAQTITITVTNANDNSPQFTSANNSNVNVPENSTEVLNLIATDGDTLTYTLGDTDEGLFIINGNVLSFDSTPDFESPNCGVTNDSNVCTISITASDGLVANNTAKTITVTVTDICAGDDGFVLDDNNNQCLLDFDNDGVDDTTDLDYDNNGFIEIHNLDMLDHMRNNLAGTSYNNGVDAASTTGAPTEATTACTTDSDNDGTFLCGYELARNLNFDSADSYESNSSNYASTGGNTSTSTNFNAGNANDKASALNPGWTPIGDTSNLFTAIFDGNHFTITHLYMNRSTGNIGFFGYISNATIRNIGVTESYLKSTGGYYPWRRAGCSNQG